MYVTRDQEDGKKWNVMDENNAAPLASNLFLEKKETGREKKKAPLTTANKLASGSIQII